MNKSNVRSIVFLALMTIAIFMGVVLVRQNQELKRGAYFADNITVFLLPEESQTIVGDVVPIQIWVSSGSNKVDGVQVDMCYGDGLELPDDEIEIYDSVVLNTGNGFTQKPLVLGLDNNCVRVAVSSDRPESQLKSGVVHVATVNFEASQVGSGEVTMALAKTTVTGDNPEGGCDTYMRVVAVNGASYDIGDGGEPEITGTPSSDGGVWANYKVAFIGVRPANKCTTGWQTKLVALSGSTKKEYANIQLTKTSEVNENGETIFSGSKKLTGFTATSNVALFFKGPKHLQVKYGKQNQTEFYNQAGGELTLTASADTSTVYDFSEYPMLAGDVDGSGAIDGIDFSLVKGKAKDFKQVAEGTNIVEDLDGSCQVNNIDVRLLVESLNEKQDQVY